MKKSILNLNGALELSKNEQKNVNGGVIPDLSQGCNYVLFRSTESQCLGMSYNLRPIWNPSTKMCSVLEFGNCAD